MTDRIYSFLGIARKSGRLITGKEGCEKAVKAQKAQLFLVARDASDNTSKKFLNMCNSHKTSVRMFGTRERLGRAAGKGETAVMCVTDRSMANKLEQMIDRSDGGAVVWKK